MDKYGFPRTSAKSASVIHGVRTGDMVVADVPTGKKAGHWQGRVAVRSSGSFNIRQGEVLVQGIGGGIVGKSIERMDTAMRGKLWPGR